MQTQTCLHWLNVPSCWFDYGITNSQGMFVPFEIDEVLWDGLSIGLASAVASQLEGWSWALLFGSYFGGCSALPDASHSVGSVSFFLSRRSESCLVFSFSFPSPQRMGA